MNPSFNSDVPGWDGNPSTFLAFEVACKWFEKTLKETERRGAAARVWSRLSGSVVKHLSAEDFDCAGGLDKLLQVLRASSLQSLPIPDSSAEKWHQLRRRDQESIPELLVREDELFLELQQSLVRSRARERPATTLTGPSGAGATTAKELRLQLLQVQPRRRRTTRRMSQPRQRPRPRTPGSSTMS